VGARVSKRLRLFVLTWAAVGLSSLSARAESIGPTCGTCQGSIYTLENLGLASADLYADDGSFDTFRIALTIDINDYIGTGVRIDEVAVKVSSSVNTAKLTDAPGGLGVWSLMPGGLNAYGCTGSGSGFECSDWLVGSLDGAFIYAGGPETFKWIFEVDISSPLLTAANEASIKVRYVDDANRKVGALVSENITLGTVPEPGTFGLLAIGVGSIIARRRGAKA
jgi:hypothetical protein